MVLAFARAGIPPSELDAMPVALAQAISDLLMAQAQAQIEESARA